MKPSATISTSEHCVKLEQDWLRLADTVAQLERREDWMELYFHLYGKYRETAREVAALTVPARQRHAASLQRRGLDRIETDLIYGAAELVVGMHLASVDQCRGTHASLSRLIHTAIALYGDEEDATVTAA